MSNMHKIIDVDYERNQAGGEHSKEYIHAIMDQYVLHKGKYFETDSVFIIYKNLDENTVEIHCVNGGSGADLTEAINTLLKQLATNYKKVVTYYDNPRVNDLVKYSYFPAKVEKIDDGLDRTYEMSFELRS